MLDLTCVQEHLVALKFNLEILLRTDPKFQVSYFINSSCFFFFKRSSMFYARAFAINQQSDLFFKSDFKKTARCDQKVSSWTQDQPISRWLFLPRSNAVFCSHKPIFKVFSRPNLRARTVPISLIRSVEFFQPICSKTY